MGICAAVRAELVRCRAAIDGLRGTGHRPVSVVAAMVASIGIVAAGNAVVVLGRVSEEPTWATLLGVPTIALVGGVVMLRSGSSRAELGLVAPSPSTPVLGRRLTVLGLVVASIRIAVSVAWAGPSVLLDVIRLAFGTALGEEVVHRGVVLALWCRTGLQARWILAANAAVFVTWHLAGATKATGFAWLDLAGPLAGSPVLLWLRLRSASLLGPFALHLTPNSFGLPR